MGFDWLLCFLSGEVQRTALLSRGVASLHPRQSCPAACSSAQSATKARRLLPADCSFRPQDCQARDKMFVGQWAGHHRNPHCREHVWQRLHGWVLAECNAWPKPAPATELPAYHWNGCVQDAVEERGQPTICQQHFGRNHASTLQQRWLPRPSQHLQHQRIHRDSGQPP